LGVDNPSKSLCVRKKILKQTGFVFTFPSGKTCLIDSSAEENVLKILLRMFNESKIIPQPDIKIGYFNDGDESEHFWFPDIIIKREIGFDCCIEVKTMKAISFDIEETIRKLESASKMGFDPFLFIWYDAEKIIFNVRFVNFDEKICNVKVIGNNHNDITEQFVKMRLRNIGLEVTKVVL